MGYNTHVASHTHHPTQKSSMQGMGSAKLHAELLVAAHTRGVCLVNKVRKTAEPTGSHLLKMRRKDFHVSRTARPSPSHVPQKPPARVANGRGDRNKSTDAAA